MNSLWGDCHIHNTKGRSGPCHSSACLGFHVTTMKLSHKTEALAILCYLFNRIFELLWFYTSVLQHLTGEWCAHHLLWKHAGALGILFSTYFQQWLWSVMHKNKECLFSRKVTCNTFFFQSRMRSPKDWSNIGATLKQCAFCLSDSRGWKLLL